MLVKTQFSIKDLENLSGVKAHTIRIWEKRYNLLAPNRTDTNIRKYDLENLKKLLNVTFLYNEGFKISKIAAFKQNEIEELIQNQSQQHKETFAITSFKTAMFDFDNNLFAKTYNGLLQDRSFRYIFFEVFIPLLNEIGMLWQTGTIDPAHERFISELIKQKIILHIEEEQQKSRKNKDFAFVLYLPYEEIHEIGLLYTNYEILSQGFSSLYLGSNIPLESLKHVTKHHDKIVFISYFTVKPDQETVLEYLQRYNDLICTDTKHSLWLLGSKLYDTDLNKLPSHVQVFRSLKELSNTLETLK